MEVIEAISERKSIRGYKPEPVSMGILKKVLETAVHSPSAMNTQPWEVDVISGETISNGWQNNYTGATFVPNSCLWVWVSSNL